MTATKRMEKMKLLSLIGVTFVSCNPVYSYHTPATNKPASKRGLRLSLLNHSRRQTKYFSFRRGSKIDDFEAKVQGCTFSDEIRNGLTESEPNSYGFGESVPYTSRPVFGEPTTKSDNIDEGKLLQQYRLRNVVVAIASFSFAIFNYVWQLTHPVTAVEMLATMQSQSAPLTAIGNNGKPTVIDFWAPWCENCKFAAPTLQSIEKEYGDRVNFIMVNGDEARNWPLIELFGVDAIPHLALLSDEGDVETALIGPMSRNVLRADIDALLHKREDCDAAPSVTLLCHDDLPYQMYDAFGNRRDGRRINFVK
mmetsp:Transcript_11798/g.23979  ORF Transcript_11798/g.23979 Transcript_11798/m.23979 type:complete len:309 (-) Transcript_11798:202-1128(-)